MMMVMTMTTTTMTTTTTTMMLTTATTTTILLTTVSFLLHSFYLFFLFQGYFTAPVAGVYSFLGSVQTLTDSQHPSGTEVDVALMVGAYTVDFSTTFGRSQNGLVHAVTHLKQGERAFVQSYRSSVLWEQPCSFSGFLLYADDSS
jgi:hypothetical protein